MKDIILRHLNRINGVKAVDLALHCIDLTSPKSFDTDEYHSIIADLTDSGEIVEINYLEPDRGQINIRTIYFRKGTVFFPKGVNVSSNQDSMVRKSERNT